MQQVAEQNYNYKVGHITFLVTPIYSPERGETMLDILLKLMRADVVRKYEKQ